MSRRFCLILCVVLLQSSCGSPRTEGPSPNGGASPKVATNQADTQVAELQSKITKWQSNRDKLKKLLEQLQQDKTSILEKLVQLGVKSESDLANNPKGQVLHGELKDIVKQIVLYDKKYQDYDLAILKSESRLRSIARQLSARDAGVSDTELEELTRSMVTLDESLSSEKDSAVPIDLKDTLKNELARFHEGQQASSGSKTPSSETPVAATVESPPAPNSPPLSTRSEKAAEHAAAHQEVTLFNGHDLDGWSVVYLRYSKSHNSTSWHVDPARGVLVSSGGDFNELRTDRLFKNFVLRWSGDLRRAGLLESMGVELWCDPTAWGQTATIPKGSRSTCVPITTRRSSWEPAASSPMARRCGTIRG